MKAWYCLARRRAQHSILGLGYTVVVLYVQSLKALRNKHHLLCTVSINSVLAEALTVCLSSFFSERQRVPASRSAAYVNAGRKARQRFRDICVVLAVPCRLYYHSGLAPRNHCFSIHVAEPVRPASSPRDHCVHPCVRVSETAADGSSGQARDAD